MLLPWFVMRNNMAIRVVHAFLLLGSSSATCFLAANLLKLVAIHSFPPTLPSHFIIMEVYLLRHSAHNLSLWFSSSTQSYSQTWTGFALQLLVSFASSSWWALLAAPWELCFQLLVSFLLIAAPYGALLAAPYGALLSAPCELCLKTSYLTPAFSQSKSYFACSVMRGGVLIGSKGILFYGWRAKMPLTRSRWCTE